jgi:hypothetical protein
VLIEMAKAQLEPWAVLGFPAVALGMPHRASSPTAGWLGNLLYGVGCHFASNVIAAASLHGHVHVMCV